jgi:hypothetical protein
MQNTNRLRLVIFQEAPGLWVARGLEHDLGAEARSIGGAVKAVLRLVEAHTAFDKRHAHRPLSAFSAAPQAYWNAFASGLAIPLDQIGVSGPGEWEIHLAFAGRQPSVERRAQEARAHTRMSAA